MELKTTEKIDPDVYKSRAPNITEEGQVRNESDSAKRSHLVNLHLYFCDFCDNTSIHGWKFLGERQRYLVEKLWWFIVIILAIYGSTALILETYRKWNSSPVIVSFATTETPIWSVPFPAVTICPGTKNNIDMFNVTRALVAENLTESDSRLLDLFSIVCPGDSITPSWNATEIMDDMDFFYFIIGYLYQPGLDICRWIDKFESCDKLFNKKVTSEGICYTFNMLNMDNLYTEPLDLLNLDTNTSNVENWTLEDGYAKGAALDTFPKRTFISSSKGGLFIQQCINKENLDYSCTELQGFKVTLHHPAEEPDMDDHFWLPLNQVVMAAIKPKMIVTSKEIKSYPPEKRGCFIPGEKILSSYKYYTQKNCMTECLSNYTRTHCGCSPFYDYHLHFFEDIQVCAAGKQECVENAKVQFLSEETESKLRNAKSEIGQCDCLPSCTSLDFSAETSQIDWEWKKTMKIVDGEAEEEDDCSRLYIYYKEMQFMTSERHELYGVLDFLANCGGLLGLFCGFSFTSVIEILYYCTLRLICNLKMFGRKQWSGTKVD